MMADVPLMAGKSVLVTGGTGVTATVLHPGAVRTSFGAEDQAAHIVRHIDVAPEPLLDRMRDLGLGSHNVSRGGKG